MRVGFSPSAAPPGPANAPDAGAVHTRSPAPDSPGTAATPAGTVTGVIDANRPIDCGPDTPTRHTSRAVAPTPPELRYTATRALLLEFVLGVGACTVPAAEVTVPAYTRWVY